MGHQKKRDTSAKKPSWAHLLQVVWDTVARLPDPETPVVLNFWSSRGGGKTAFLDAVRDGLAPARGATLLGRWSASDLTPARLIPEILQAIQNFSGAKGIILLDDLDVLLRSGEGAAFFDLERAVVYPLTEREDILLVTTSWIEVAQWRDSDVLYRQRNYRLPALTRREVGTAGALSADQVFALTLGHPRVVSWLKEEPGLSEEQLAYRAEDFFLEGLSPAARELTRTASLLPAFDVAVLRSIMTSKEEEPEGFYTSCLDRVAELKRAGLVSWDGEVGAYRFCDGVVRRLLARSLACRDEAHFHEIHQRAAEYYQKEASRPGFLHYSLVSALYHLAQAEDAADAGARCLQWVEQSAPHWAGADWNKVLHYWQTGAEDKTVVDEIGTLIGPGTVKQITRLLELARKESSAERSVALPDGENHP